MALENGLYEQVFMIRRSELDDKKGKYQIKQITYKDNQQEQNIGSIFIMSG